jgi:hypothetical protein
MVSLFVIQGRFEFDVELAEVGSTDERVGVRSVGYFSE